MALLDNGGKVVVIGARQSNVGDLWNHPQIVFMDGEDATKRGLPANARGVLFTRFMNHSSFGAIVAEARKRNMTIFPVQGTGELKTTLNQLIAEAKPKPPRHHDDQPLQLLNPPQRPAVPEAPAESEILWNHWQVKDYLGCSNSAIKLWRDKRLLMPATIGQGASRGGKTLSRTFLYRPADVEAFKLKHNPQVRSKNKEKPSAPKTEPAPPKERSPEGRAPDVRPVESALVDLVDNAIAALQLIREEAIRVESGKSELRRQFEQIFGKS